MSSFSSNKEEIYSEVFEEGKFMIFHDAQHLLTISILVIIFVSLTVVEAELAPNSTLSHKGTKHRRLPKVEPVNE